MQKILMGVLASVAFLWSHAAQAVPNAPFFATAEMMATVRSVSVSGNLLDANGNFVRQLTASDLPILPLATGDRITVRWELHSDDLQYCGPGDRHFVFGGLAFPAEGSNVGRCFGNDTGFPRLERANGMDGFISDGFESLTGIGPRFDMVAGEVVPTFNPVDGLVTNCCVYLYDAENDRIIGLETNGGNPDDSLPGWPFHYFGGVSFEEETGGGWMNLLPSQVFGYHDLEDPETGMLVPLGWIESARIVVNFDVEWRSTFERLDVPEPGTLALAGVGLLAGAGMASRRRMRRAA